MKFEMLMHPTGLIKAMSVFTQHIKRIRLRAYLFHILFYGTGIWVWEPDHIFQLEKRRAQWWIRTFCSYTGWS
jgi:hypothetical protein